MHSGQVGGNLVPAKDFGADKTADFARSRLERVEALTIYCDKSDICDTHLERVETLLRDAEVGRLAQMERLRWRTPVCPWGNCFIMFYHMVSREGELM